VEQQRPSRFYSPDALEGAIDPATYVLGPSDILALMLMLGEVKLERLPVLPEGVVLVPGVGAIPAAGRSLDEFRQELRHQLSQHYKDFELYCYLAEARQFRVHVTGEVREPGTLVARAYERVSQIIERAGGFTANASRRHVELRDGLGNLVMPVDLDAYYLRGQLAANPVMQPGQVIFVPARRLDVEITGAVALPGMYERLPGETLRDLLQLAGGPMPQADLTRVSVDRIDAQGHVQVQEVDLATANPVVGDAVRVSVLSSLLGQRRVFVTLPPNRRETLYLSAEETLRSLLPRVMQLEPNAALDEAELVSRDSTGAQEERRVDVTRVLAGEMDYPLHDGDVFSVPSVKDYVYVSGLVGRPGRYPYQAAWRVGDYLGEAGGTATGGNRDHVTILSDGGRPRSGDRASVVEQGETIHVNRSTSSKVASALSIVTTVSAFVISIVALTK
jgi:protein involved in polysaccharide export with SLBB domain